MRCSSSCAMVPDLSVALATLLLSRVHTSLFSCNQRAFNSFADTHVIGHQQTNCRLLVADDVGIGKTIEGGLIARELLDRGEIHRMTVLCPPHLCEQWQRELAERFHIHAVVVRSASAARLERDLPPGTSVFDAHPFTVVSLDYIKSER